MLYIRFIPESQFRFLFVAQSVHRVNVDGATRRDAACGDGDKQQNQCGGGECEWIVGADAEKQACYQAHQAQGGGNADNDSKGGEFYSLAYDQAKNVAALRAESH